MNPFLWLPGGPLDTVLQALNRQIESYPQDARGYRVRGVLLSNGVNGPRDLTAALNDYNRVLVLEPEQDEHFYFQRGRLLSRMNLHGRAIRDLNLAVAMNPLGSAAFLFLARALGAHGHLARASYILDRALRLRPGWAEAFGLRGLLRLRQGRKVAALADLAQAVRLDPDSEYRVDLHWARQSAKK